jgi:hypothetical protein
MSASGLVPKRPCVYQTTIRQPQGEKRHVHGKCCDRCYFQERDRNGAFIDHRVSFQAETARRLTRRPKYQKKLLFSVEGLACCTIRLSNEY